MYFVCIQLQQSINLRYRLHDCACPWMQFLAEMVKSDPEKEKKKKKGASG